MSKEAKVLIGIAIVVVIGGVLLAIFGNPQPVDPGAPVDGQSLVRDTSYMTGKKDAKVTIVEFGDYQCPACAAANPIVKKVLADYAGNQEVNFVFRHFPLDSIHANAHISAEAAEAAGVQGKFWEMHNLLYERQAEWSTLVAPLDTFVRYAGEIGLNVDEFRTAVDQRRFAEIIGTDYSDGEKIGVNSTPTFFVNGEKLSGYQEATLKASIDAALAK